MKRKIGYVIFAIGLLAPYVLMFIKYGTLVGVLEVLIGEATILFPVIVGSLLIGSSLIRAQSSRGKWLTWGLSFGVLALYCLFFVAVVATM